MRSFWCHLEGLLLILSACGDLTAGQDPPASPGQAAIDEFLEAHNRVRRAARAEPPLDPLTWSDEAAEAARRWAEGCRYAHNTRLKELRLGENLAAFSDESGSASKAVELWASEVASWNAASGRCAAGAVCGHYSQIVWRDTAQVGCAMAACETGSPLPGHSRWQLWVCNYSPPGNVVGRRPF